MLYLSAFARSRVSRSSIDGIDELALLSNVIPEEKLRERDLVRLQHGFLINRSEFSVKHSAWMTYFFIVAQTLGILLNRYTIDLRIKFKTDLVSSVLRRKKIVLDFLYVRKDFWLIHIVSNMARDNKQDKDDFVCL